MSAEEQPRVSGGPIQRVIRLLLVLVCVIALGLVAGIVVVYVENGETSRRLAALEEYVQGKGEQRDHERAALEELMRELDRQAACDLLDQFPVGGWLDRPRAKYGCGPGIPLDQLTPQEQSRIAGRPPAVRPPEAPAGPVPGPAPGVPSLGSSAAPDRPPPPPPAPLPPRPVEPPTPLQPVIDRICDALPLCLPGAPS